MPMTARTGELRQVITIEQKSKTPDGQGGNAVIWVSFAAGVRAKVAPKIGRALATAMENGISNPVTVTIRYLAGVTGAMRINWNGKILNIVSISNTDSRNRELVIECGDKV